MAFPFKVFNLAPLHLSVAQKLPSLLLFTIQCLYVWFVCIMKTPVNFERHWRGLWKSKDMIIVKTGRWNHSSVQRFFIRVWRGSWIKTRECGNKQAQRHPSPHYTWLNINKQITALFPTSDETGWPPAHWATTTSNLRPTHTAVAGKEPIISGQYGVSLPRNVSASWNSVTVKLRLWMIIYAGVYTTGRSFRLAADGFCMSDVKMKEIRLWAVCRLKI